jgi:hypothetical protein
MVMLKASREEYTEVLAQLDSDVPELGFAESILKSKVAREITAQDFVQAAIQIRGGKGALTPAQKKAKALVLPDLDDEFDTMDAGGEQGDTDEVEDEASDEGDSSDEEGKQNDGDSSDGENKQNDSDSSDEEDEQNNGEATGRACSHGDEAKAGGDGEDEQNNGEATEGACGHGDKAKAGSDSGDAMVVDGEVTYSEPPSPTPSKPEGMGEVFRGLKRPAESEVEAETEVEGEGVVKKRRRLGWVGDMLLGNN